MYKNTIKTLQHVLDAYLDLCSKKSTKESTNVPHVQSLQIAQNAMMSSIFQSNNPNFVLSVLFLMLSQILKMETANPAHTFQIA